MIAKSAAILLALALSGTAISVASAADVPCEQALSDLRAKEASMPVSAANKAAYDELVTKGTERCNADDDARADAFFTQASGLLGK